VYVRSLGAGSSWAPFGTQLEPNQASNVTSLAFGAGRLLALAGSNGQVFFNDPNGAKVELDFAKEETAPAGA